MLSAAPGNSAKHVLLVTALVASIVVLFALLLQLVVGMAAAPVPTMVTGSFGTTRPADYRGAQERPAGPVAPQRTS